MTKTDLINVISDKTGFTKKDSEKAANAFLEAITEALKKGDKVSLVGFGSFEVRQRKARKGVHPSDKSKTIEIPACKAPAFKAGKALKDAVN